MSCIDLQKFIKFKNIFKLYFLAKSHSLIDITTRLDFIILGIRLTFVNLEQIFI